MPGVLSPLTKRMEREDDYSRTIAEVKYGWNYTSTPLSLRGSKRDNFTV